MGWFAQAGVFFVSVECQFKYANTTTNGCLFFVENNELKVINSFFVFFVSYNDDVKDTIDITDGTFEFLRSGSLTEFISGAASGSTNKNWVT